jgi:hypothetical protein
MEDQCRHFAVILIFIVKEIKKMNKLVIFVLLTLSAVVISAQNTEAVIKEMTGTVELKTSGSSVWVAAREGDRITKDTVVSTGFKSIALITAGNSIITVRPLTRLSLAELLTQNETETVNVNLNTGRIRVEVNPPAGSRANFTVRTPSSVASVRGTTFEMNTVNIHVSEGAVNYRAANGTFNNRPVLVTAGHESWIDARTDSAVHPMTASEANRNLPVLPGQNAMPPAESGARLEVTDGNGEITMGVTFEGGK